MKFIKKLGESNRLKAIITEFTAGILVVMYVTFLLMPNTVGIVRPDKRIGKMEVGIMKKMEKKLNRNFRLSLIK